MWDMMVLVKLQLPTLDVNEPMENLVKYIPSAEVPSEYDTGSDYTGIYPLPEPANQNTAEG
jgi:hypothetical protein